MRCLSLAKSQIRSPIAGQHAYPRPSHPPPRTTRRRSQRAPRPAHPGLRQAAWIREIWQGSSMILALSSPRPCDAQQTWILSINTCHPLPWCWTEARSWAMTVLGSPVNTELPATIIFAPACDMSSNQACMCGTLAAWSMLDGPRPPSTSMSSAGYRARRSATCAMLCGLIIRFTRLGHHVEHEGLAAEPGLNRHDQHHVHLRRHRGMIRKARASMLRRRSCAADVGVPGLMATPTCGV